MKLEVVKKHRSKMMDFNLSPFTGICFNEYKMHNNVFLKVKAVYFLSTILSNKLSN